MTNLTVNNGNNIMEDQNLREIAHIQQMNIDRKIAEKLMTTNSVLGESFRSKVLDNFEISLHNEIDLLLNELKKMIYSYLETTNILKKRERKLEIDTFCDKYRDVFLEYKIKGEM